MIQSELSKNEIVKTFIQQQLNKKLYLEGQMIDSEHRLCEILSVSRMTVRKAIDELVGEGLLFKEKGRGTFVAIKPKYSEFTCGIAFSKEAIKRGMVPSTIDATLKLISATKEIADDLQIKVGDKVWHITRVRCADGIPIVYAEEYIIYAQCDDLTLDITTHSLYEHLETKGIVSSYADQKLEAVLANKKVASKLQIKEGSPLIQMSLVAHMHNGTPFNCGIEYFRTDKYTLIQTIFTK